jgi:thiopeptide-type bacteriocin biosynthesis protein
LIADETEQGMTPSGFFVMRTPLLPFDELLAWSDGLQATASDEPERLYEAFAADRRRLRERLRCCFVRPEVREALFLASPALEERFDLWLHDPDSEQGLKIERTLVRYFARMAGRATPFGLFAGCSVGTMGPETHLSLLERAQYQRHSRFDMDYLVSLTDALARQKEVGPTLMVRVNSSLYRTSDRFRYLEVRQNDKGSTHHHVALQADEYLDAILARAQEGISPKALVAMLLEVEPTAPREEAEVYIEELINNQVLVPELRPAVTGVEPVHALVARLRERADQSSTFPAGHAEACEIEPEREDGIAKRLQQACQELQGIDESGLGVEPARYRRLAEWLAGLPATVQLGRLFQVDLVKPAAASLGPSVVEEIQRGVALLHRLGPRPHQDLLARFREAFCIRYERRAVPLLEALDENAGIGLTILTGGVTDGSSLLDGLDLSKTAEEPVRWGRRESFLLRKLSVVLASGAREVVLTPQDVEQMADSSPPLPDAFAAVVTVSADSDAGLAHGEFELLLHSVSGPSGARLLGRFCHADPCLRQFVAEHLRAEEAFVPDAIFAEIVHLPEGRLGNILARPVMRDYEIPYLGTAGVAKDRQIPVTDLLVSVAGEQIILSSVRLGRRVIPRLTSAHNYHMSKGIYQFLCALQSQGTASELAWDWGPLDEAPFLPRVVCGRLVLCRARWRISTEELKLLGQAAGAARFRAVQSWRITRRLPRWVALADADNELPVDLDNVLAVDTFVELVKELKGAILVEVFPGFDRLCSRGPDGRFTHELVVPFVRADKGSQKRDRAALHATPYHRAVHGPDERRSFPPGSEWLYFKIYTGPATADQVLYHVVRPVVETALHSGAADRWFFVRYGDPDWHLRLRLHGLPERLQAEVLRDLHSAVAPLLDDGRVWRVQLDTYEREVERYGGAEGIRLAEEVFHVDSEAILVLASQLRADAREDLRWRLVLFGAHLLLMNLGLDLATRRELVRTMRNTFAAEFQTDASFRHRLGNKFRLERTILQELLAEAPRVGPELHHGMEVLRRRSNRLAPVLADLKACHHAGRLSVPLTELASSYLHMHANRLLRSAHRAQELVLYDFLSRLYDSQEARERQ